MDVCGARSSSDCAFSGFVRQVRSRAAGIKSVVKGVTVRNCGGCGATL